MAIKVGKGKAEVTISGPIADGLEAELRALLPDMIEEMEREADQILEVDIGENWPERTGRSLDGWFKSIRIQPDSFIVEVVLDNPWKYVRYIRSTRILWRANATRIRSPFSEHGRKPATKARRRLKKVLPAMLAAALQREVS